MSISGGDILLKGEVKARLRYRSDSSLYDFLKDEKNGFSMAFIVGGLICCYEDEVDAWISKQSEKRGICTS